MTSEQTSEPCKDGHWSQEQRTVKTYDNGTRDIEVWCKDCGQVYFPGTVDKDGRPVLLDWEA